MSHPGSGVETPLPKFFPTTMPKKINTEERPLTEADDTLRDETTTAAGIPDETGAGHSEAASNRSGTKTLAKPEKPAEENHTGAQTPDTHVLDLLKKFPSYPSLYIDVHGGTFSPDTPAAIRGEAVLYENPFYNELKNKS